MKKRRVFGKMFIVCINAQRQRHFDYIRLNLRQVIIAKLTKQLAS
jgi:hypothetical protein